MDKAVLFLAMVFMHIIDDFHIQAFLSNLKQKSWWDKEFVSIAKDDTQLIEVKKKYGKDFIVGLIAHSFEWTFMMMLPAAVSLYRSGSLMPVHIVLFAANVVIHAIVDHLKCNAMKLNLIQDQLIHLVQITATFILMMIL